MIWSMQEDVHRLYGLPQCLNGKEFDANADEAGDPGSISELRQSSGEGNGYQLQYSCLENPDLWT